MASKCVCTSVTVGFGARATGELPVDGGGDASAEAGGGASGAGAADFRIPAPAAANAASPAPEIEEKSIAGLQVGVPEAPRAPGTDYASSCVAPPPSAEEPQQVLILSSDKDFKQLQLAPFSSGNVRQWSPMQKKYVTASKQEIMDFTIEHIVKGDTGDGIPNLLSADDVFVKGERQKTVSSKRLQEFIENGKTACRNDEERRNWDRNARLVAFDNIPEDVKKDITDAYLNTKPTGDKMAIMNYLIQNRCRLLLDEIEDF